MKTKALVSISYLSDAGVTHSDDVEESGHDLGQELNTLEAQRLEDEGDGLDHHGVVVGQRRVPQDTHQSHYGNCRVELIQGEVAHVHQHLTGAVVSWDGKMKNRLEREKEGRERERERQRERHREIMICYGETQFVFSLHTNFHIRFSLALNNVF